MDSNVEAADFKFKFNIFQVGFESITQCGSQRWKKISKGYQSTIKFNIHAQAKFTTSLQDKSTVTYEMAFSQGDITNL